MILVALLWTRSKSSMSFLYWGPQAWMQYSTWGLTSRHNHLSLPDGHPFFNAAQNKVGLLGCKRTLLAHVQLLIYQVDDIHRPSPVHRSHHSIIEGHQIGQAQSALGEAMLAVSNHLFVSYVP